jgi:hypothetical protein
MTYTFSKQSVERISKTVKTVEAIPNSLVSPASDKMDKGALQHDFRVSIIYNNADSKFYIYCNGGLAQSKGSYWNLAPLSVEAPTTGWTESYVYTTYTFTDGFGDIDFAANADLDSTAIRIARVDYGGVGGKFSVKQIVYGGIIYTPPALPVGAVIPWYGDYDAIPIGFAYCDGTNGTPDMRGLFLRGTNGATLPLNSSGGDTTNTHSHDLMSAYTSTLNYQAGQFTETFYKGPGVTDTAEIDILPPYYCLHYIMFKGV